MTEKNDDNLMAALSYLLGVITGVLVYVMYKDKKNKLVLFHAVQSSLLSVICMIVMIPVATLVILVGMILPGLGCILDLVILIPVALVILGVAVFAMLKAYKGEKYMLPVIGQMADKYSG
ncbi:MAG: DUF4870 domain-containing protein [Candidatus Altiarchaeota archaeon]|nr:DUF4870 domain-containing protein [Candidatus Altiarchaeota archaeon]